MFCWNRLPSQAENRCRQFSKAWEYIKVPDKLKLAQYHQYIIYSGKWNGRGSPLSAPMVLKWLCKRRPGRPTDRSIPRVLWLYWRFWSMLAAIFPTNVAKLVYESFESFLILFTLKFIENTFFNRREGQKPMERVGSFWETISRLPPENLQRDPLYVFLIQLSLDLIWSRC